MSPFNPLPCYTSSSMCRSCRQRGGRRPRLQHSTSIFKKYGIDCIWNVENVQILCLVYIHRASWGKLSTVRPNWYPSITFPLTSIYCLEYCLCPKLIDCFGKPRGTPISITPNWGVETEYFAHLYISSSVLLTVIVSSSEWTNPGVTPFRRGICVLQSDWRHRFHNVPGGDSAL